MIRQLSGTTHAEMPHGVGLLCCHHSAAMCTPTYMRTHVTQWRTPVLFASPTAAAGHRLDFHAAANTRESGTLHFKHTSAASGGQRQQSAQQADKSMPSIMPEVRNGCVAASMRCCYSPLERCHRFDFAASRQTSRLRQPALMHA